MRRVEANWYVGNLKLAVCKLQIPLETIQEKCCSFEKVTAERGIVTEKLFVLLPQKLNGKLCRKVNFR